ncbi:LysM domain-containing protein [Penicillium rolfsii]|nr:LysM domain-containing protein [Penicillium rolfsii]
MVSNCNAFHLVASGDSCQAIATEAGVSLADFFTWNPTVGSGCASLWLGYYVCTGIAGDPTTTISPTSTQSSGTKIITPTPIQSNVVANCDVFYMFKSGDTCQAIASTSMISLTDFYAWNPTVGSGCTSLLAGDYVCVMITGFTVTTSTKPATTTSGNGIPTPSPTQSGMADDCDQFHLVMSGDSCASIASSAGISLANFYSWNPTVGNSCSNLWLGYYVCVDIVGYISTATTRITTTSTTTTAGNGVTTPTPIQAGMVADCDKFYLVGTGASCSAIATEEGVTVAQIESWNSRVGSGCTDLWLGHYICVGVL